ncbi:MAG: BACON domain-containing protein [Prevotella sp.]|nr:BACON domain-containing protein [Prevotella sp.]
MKKSIIFGLLLALLPVFAQAQSECQSLYNQGIALQKKKTVSAQNQAIAKFKAAKVCYDSQANKSKCDAQIAKCNKTIAALNNPKPAKTEKPTQTDKPQTNKPTKPSKPVQAALEFEVRPAKLTFKGNGEDVQVVRVTTNDRSWRVETHDSWITATRESENQIVVRCEKNGRKKRSGKIYIYVRNKRAVVDIQQKKHGIF